MAWPGTGKNLPVRIHLVNRTLRDLPQIQRMSSLLFSSANDSSGHASCYRRLKSL